MTPDDPRHGTSAGYDTHRRDNEPACDQCKDGAARYEYDRRIGRILGRTRTTPGLGSARRIQALVALGWSYTDLAPEFGWAHDGPRKIAFQGDSMIRSSTAERVAAVYERLSMTTPPHATGAERRRAAIAKTTAKRYGWVPPLAWDDIDDPNERPHTGTDRWGRTRDADVDPVVVTRILAGDWRLPCTAAEKAAVVAAWDGSHYRLAQLTGWKVERYTERSEDVA